MATRSSVLLEMYCSGVGNRLHVGVEDGCSVEYKRLPPPLSLAKYFYPPYLFSSLRSSVELPSLSLIPVIMEPKTPAERAALLVRALEQHGQGDYIGESISQLEHSLQAADQARKSGKIIYGFTGPCHNSLLNTGARDELVMAALFHDIGQIIPLDSTKEVRMNLRGSTKNVGRVGHEAIGAAYLQSLRFSETVCRLVNSHVAAKRYFPLRSPGSFTNCSFSWIGI